MYEESSLERLRRMHPGPELDEMELQLIEFYRFLRSVVDAGSWKLYVRAPRAALVALRRLCEKERARPPPELARLFALDKFIFWRVLSFWRSDRDLPPHITTRKTTAPYYYW